MGKKKLNTSKINVSTQACLDIAEIKKNTVILKDGTIRAVLMVSSINFALKSEDEQNAIVSAYVNFLNNLDFPLQIVIQSRELDIDEYVDRLKKRRRNQTNELLKMQTSEYIQYIEELVSLGRIMNKRFYVTIPFDPLSDTHKSFFASLTEALKPATLIKMRAKKFKRYREKLDRRVEAVISGLGSVGLNAVELDTQGLIELFYNVYNPITSKHENLINVDQMRLRTDENNF